MDGGKMASPRTRTSRVPSGDSQPLHALARLGLPVARGKGHVQWISRTIAGLFEAVVGVAVRSQNGDFVAEPLEANRGVDYQPLGAANAEIGMDEDHALRR